MKRVRNNVSAAKLCRCGSNKYLARTENGRHTKQPLTSLPKAKQHKKNHGPHLEHLPGISASVAALPQDAMGLSGKSSTPFMRCAIFRAEIVSLKCSRQASVEHRRHNVFPVPVGLSKMPFTFFMDKENSERSSE